MSEPEQRAPNTPRQSAQTKPTLAVRRPRGLSRLNRQEWSEVLRVIRELAHKPPPPPNIER